jgi:DNA-binding transcriptional ArsR family regulator
MADNSGPPGYDLPERLELTSPTQYRALFEETRSQIVSLLLERAATTSELAEVFDKPKGTVGHHLKVLEDAGPVRVVRTERVRALEAKYYGRTARTFLYHLVGEAAGQPQRILATAAAEIRAVPPAPTPADAPPGAGNATANLRYARIPADRAGEWAERLNDLVVEFAGEPRGGDVTYAIVVALYPTRRPPLPPAAAQGPEAPPSEPEEAG